MGPRPVGTQPRREKGEDVQQWGTQGGSKLWIRQSNSMIHCRVVLRISILPPSTRSFSQGNYSSPRSVGPGLRMCSSRTSFRELYVPMHTSYSLLAGETRCRGFTCTCTCASLGQVRQMETAVTVNVGRLGFGERITALDECTPNMFIAVVEAILRVQVPEVYRDPTTLEGISASCLASRSFCAFLQ